MSTFIPSAKSIERRWHVIDAAGRSLGRVASLAAKVLQGKHKPIYTPYIDCGDHVIVVNAGAAVLTGQKEEQKLYRYHSGYEGGLREERAKDLRKRRPAHRTLETFEQATADSRIKVLEATDRFRNEFEEKRKAEQDAQDKADEEASEEATDGAGKAEAKKAGKK